MSNDERSVGVSEAGGGAYASLLAKVPHHPEALVEELGIVAGDAILKRDWPTEPPRIEDPTSGDTGLLRAAKERGMCAARAVLAHLTRRGVEGLPSVGVGALARKWADKRLDVRWLERRREYPLPFCDGFAEGRASVAPLLAARDAALEEAHGELERAWATRDERDEIYRELVAVRKAHQECYLGWNACMKERDAIRAENAALTEARAEVERLRGIVKVQTEHLDAANARCRILERERDETVERVNTEKDRAETAEQERDALKARLDAVMALTEDDLTSRIASGQWGDNPVRAVLDLIRSRAGGGGE